MLIYVRVAIASDRLSQVITAMSISYRKKNGNFN